MIKMRVNYRIGLIYKELLFLIFLANFFNIYAQEYKFRNFLSETGLPQLYVYSILQDNDGSLWIGTGSGLSRYNGFEFENFSMDDSLADNFITCGINDGEDIWFGHMNGQISWYHEKRFYTVHTRGSKSPVTHFTKSTDGQIWASTRSDGLFKLNRLKKTFEAKPAVDLQGIYNFEFISKDELLLGTDAGLMHYKLKKSGQLTEIGRINEIPESKITAILKRKKSPGYYIATENDGLFSLSYENSTFQVVKIIANPEYDFTGIQDIYEDNRSDVWIGSFGNGLVKLHFQDQKRTIMTRYDRTAGFSCDNVKTIFEDREGNIWSGNYGDGLTQITSRTFFIYSYDRLSYGNAVFSIYTDQNFRWIGTDRGMLKTDEATGRILKFYGGNQDFPKDTVTAIYSADGNDLWFGTNKNGLFKLDSRTDKIINYEIHNGSLERSITMITGRGNQIWVGTKKGLCLIRVKENQIDWFTINRGGLPQNMINSLYLDKKDRLWVTTNSSVLACIQDNKVQKIALNSRTPISMLGPVTEDLHSRIWVGSKGNGIFIVKPDSIMNFTSRDGLLSDYCYSLVCDDHDNIWIGHKSGLSRIKITDFSVTPIPKISDISGDCRFNSNASEKDLRKKIWFGTDKGLIFYDPLTELKRKVSPVLRITSVKINDEEISAHQKIILSPGNYKIRIDFLGISLKEPSMVTYQYKLDGYDKTTEISKNTSVTYNHLTQGTYRFNLRALGVDGKLSESPVILTIIIQKPIWEEGWFYVISIILLALLIYLFIKWRLHWLMVEKSILEEKVLERTAEIQCQKNEIELQRDLIEKKNANITSSILYASQIQNAVLPPAELIQKLLPDSFILNLPKDIVSGDFFWLAEKNNKVIFTVADCTGHGVPGSFMSVLGITLINEIVNILGMTRSVDIVSALRDRLIQSLQQDRKKTATSDGLDIALCVMDPEAQKIQFTGGMNDLVYFRNNKMEEMKGDNLSVSVSHENLGDFTMKEFNYRKGDVLYLFSDGYPDQFGGKNDKKYLRHRFKNTLLEIYKLPMKEQKQILEKNLRDWMGSAVQTDDITVMGVRL